MAPVKILAFAGATREQSLNKKLIRIAAKGVDVRAQPSGTPPIAEIQARHA